jgi:DtxR family Mn-dependent transcriptional regulator
MDHLVTLESISATMQMYLKAIYEIQRRKGAARVTDIADRLGVKKGSVSVALRTLAAKELVNYAPYDVITLTDQGRSAAEELDRRYGTLRDFFISVLGIEPEAADREACDLEHHISRQLYERLIGFTDYYQNCTETKFRWNPELGGFCSDSEDS